ncbi:MAG: DUF3293 domain-containing protein [Burkholderiales bacterium]|nr:DUF3293 domain-containing protein [Burkholderiales bacterium]
MTDALREFERAYRNTTYLVDHPDGGFGIRLGEPCARLDALLAMHGVETWAYVTAWNPRSQRLPDADNVAQHAELLACVAKSGYPVFTGRGQPESGGWVPEESLLILGITEDAALRLGRAFDQHAIVVGKAGGRAGLRWCERKAEGGGR